MIAGLGYNGRGVAMAHVMGKILADYVQGVEPEALPLPVLPPRRIPFRLSKQFGGMGPFISGQSPGLAGGARLTRLFTGAVFIYLMNTGASLTFFTSMT